MEKRIIVAVILMLAIGQQCSAMDAPITPRSGDPHGDLVRIDVTTFPCDTILPGTTPELLLASYGVSFCQLIAKCQVPLRNADHKIIIDSCMSGDRRTLLLLTQKGEMHVVNVQAAQPSSRHVLLGDTTVAITAIAPCAEQSDCFLCVTHTGLVYRFNPNQADEAPELCWYVDNETVNLTDFKVVSNFLLSKDAAGHLKMWHRDNNATLDVSEKALPNVDRYIATYDLIGNSTLLFCTMNGVMGWYDMMSGDAVPRFIPQKVSNPRKILHLGQENGNDRIALLTLEGDLCVYELSEKSQKPLCSLVKCAKAGFLSITSCVCSDDKNFIIGSMQDGTVIVWSAIPPFNRLFFCTVSVYTPLKTRFMHQIDKDWFVMVGENGSVSKMPVLFLLNAKVPELLLMAKLSLYSESRHASEWHADWRAIYHQLPQRIKTLLKVDV